MKYLLASDLDGTIKRNRQTLPQDMEAIAHWQKQGHIFCLCSGRAPLSGLQEMEKCGLRPDLLICSNGAAAIDMKGNYFFRNTLPADAPRKIFELAHRYHVSAINGQDYEGNNLSHSYIEPERTTVTVEELLAMENFIQFNAVFKDYAEDAVAFTEQVKRELKEVTPHPNGVYIDCSPAGHDKGTGVAAAAKHFGIALENCYTIGDQNNDLPMLLPYHGAVIDTGNPETIQKVGHAVPDIATFIHEILKD